MKNTVLKLIAVAFFLGISAITVSAQTKEPKTPEELAQAEVEKMKLAIPLTDDQAKQIFELYATYQKEKAALPTDASNDEKTLVLRNYNTALKALIGAESMGDWRDYQAMEKAKRDAQKAQSAPVTVPVAPADPATKVTTKTPEEVAQDNIEKLKIGIPDLTQEQIDLLYQLNLEVERENAFNMANGASDDVKTALKRKYDIALKSIISNDQLRIWRDYTAMTKAAAAKKK